MSADVSRIDELSIALTDPRVEVVAMKRETAEELLVEIEALRIELSVAGGLRERSGRRSFSPSPNRPLGALYK